MENEKVGIIVRIKDLKEALKPIITDKTFFIVVEIHSICHYCVLKAYASPHELVGDAVIEMSERTENAIGVYTYYLPAFKDLSDFISEDLENDKCHKAVLVFDKRCSELEVMKTDCLNRRHYFRTFPNTFPIRWV
jgi:hypothetical protein